MVVLYGILNYIRHKSFKHVCVCSLWLCLPVFDIISSDVMDSLILKARCQPAYHPRQ